MIDEHVVDGYFWTGSVCRKVEKMNRRKREKLKGVGHEAKQIKSVSR